MENVDVIETKRLELSAKLHEIAENVYFQPPSNKKLKYPCIIYKRSNGSTRFADNMPYKFNVIYSVSVIDYIPNSPILYKLAMALPTITFQNHFVSDELNHDVYQLYL